MNKRFDLGAIGAVVCLSVLTQVPVASAVGPIKLTPPKELTNYQQGQLTLPCSSTAMNAVTNEGYGLNFCADLKKWSKNILNERIGNVVAYYYENKILGFDTRPGKSTFCIANSDPNSQVPGPTCSHYDPSNLQTNTDQDGFQGVQDPPNKCGMRSSRADGFCQFAAPAPCPPQSLTGCTPPPTLDLSTCGKEIAWFNGLRPNVIQHYLEDVSSAIDSGTISLVSFPDPKNPGKLVYPCGAYADAINALLTGIQNGVQNNKGYLEAQQILGLSLGVIIPCGTGNWEATFDGNTVAGLKNPPVVNNTACYLQKAREDLEVLFAHLATCEVVNRSMPLYYKYNAFANIMDDWNKKAIGPCAKYVTSLNDTDPNQALKDFYACYSGQVKGQKGVQDYFESIYQQTPTTQPLVHAKTIPDSQLEACPELPSDHAVLGFKLGTDTSSSSSSSSTGFRSPAAFGGSRFGQSNPSPAPTPTSTPSWDQAQ